MPRFAQHPDLAPALANIFCEQYESLFKNAAFISTNNGQITKSFELQGESYIIKRYPEKGPRANLRSLLGISRAMNSFSKAVLLNRLGIQSPLHLFVARQIGIVRGTSFLIMIKSTGESLNSLILNHPDHPIPPKVITNLAAITHRIHQAGLVHGDLHSGNIFVLQNQAIEVIDLDNMRPNSKKQEKDRARLLRSLESRPDLHQHLARALESSL